MLIVCASSAFASGQTVWELTPYQVQVILATAPVPELTPRLQTDLGEGLVERVNAMIGAAWDVTVVAAPPALRRAMIDDLESVTVDSLPEDSIISEPFDKVFLLAVTPGPEGYHVTARELDVRTRVWSTPVTVAAWQLAKLRDAAFQAVHNAFAPLAQIVSVEQKVVTLRVRAAGFPARDETIRGVQPGDLFRPVIRHRERSGRLRGINALPWTFLTVEDVTPTGVTCQLYSGFRSPLSGRRRGGFEQLALGVSPPGRPTRLLLKSRTDPGQALAGYDVYSHPPDEKTTDLVGRTDRQGAVIVPPAEPPLRVLLVKNGGEFLARLPVVPGVEPEMTADIPNDDQRLEAEGFINGLQEQLIDLVARRQVLLTQAQSRLDDKKLDEASDLLRKLRNLETREDFSLYLSEEKKKVFSADKIIQAKIDSLFNKTQRLVTEFLDPTPIDQLANALHKAQTASKF